jgi:Na+-translocating ferredoxin:NAD+ oxidoreductase RnfD subunit
MPEPTPVKTPDRRLAALRRFAFAITLLNVLGHLWFGFEQSYAQPLVALATAYSLELGLEWLGSRLGGRRPRYLGGLLPLANFLLSAHISGLAVAMLLYPNERLAPIAFAAATAIGSKHVFRARVGGGSRHFFNPSNLGITATLLAFPWVGIAAPYMFTENLSGAGDWILPGLFVLAGSFLNTVFTRRVPLIASWLGCFALQGVLRSLLAGTPTAVELLPMTGVAFILFTFYMVTDPATTPDSTRGQLCFGAAVAAAYGVLLALHVVFTLFFALTIVCAGRGMALALKARAAARAAAGAPVPAPRGAVERAGA